MRKLMWFGIGFAAACLLSAYLFSGLWALIFGLCVLLIAIGGLLLSGKATNCQKASVTALGLAVGLLWFAGYSAFFLDGARQADGTVVEIVAEVTDHSYATKYGSAAEAEITLENNTYRARLYLNEQLALMPGDWVEGKFKLQFTGPEGEAYSEYYSGNGLYLIGYQQGEEVSATAMEDRSLRHFPARLRHDILQKLEQMFPEDTVAFAKALLLGDRKDMDYETTTALTSSGIIHLVAVSGLHVSVLFSLVYWILGRRRLLTPLVGTVVLLFVASVTGFSPSVVRACLMNWLIVMSLAVNQEADGPTSLCFAVLVMLVINPLSVTSVGLQLSVASVIGLMLFSEPVGNWVRELPFWASAKRRTVLAYIRNSIAASVGASIGATIATAPLTALHFGTVSLVGLLTNLLTVSVANIVFILLIVAVIAGYIWLPVGGALAWVLSWPIRYILQVAILLSSVPISAVYTRSVYVTGWLVFSYAALVVYWINRKGLWQLLVCVSVTLAAALAISYAEPRMEEFRITVVDVGQGQCVLLQSEGKTYMVDCGGDYDKEAAERAVTELLSQGVFQLDGVIITHYDSDHVGGVPYVLSRMKVDALYHPGGPGDEEWSGTILRGGQNTTILVDRVQKLDWDGASLTIFPSDYQETSNESSLCVLFQKGNYDILITGDRTWAGEADLLMKYDIPQLDALVAGHHGSSSSTSEYLLSQTLPAMVLISAGEGNRYGHPTQAVLERLEAYGCIVRRTDREGTIIIRR